MQACEFTVDLEGIPGLPGGAQFHLLTVLHIRILHSLYYAEPT